MLPNLYQAVLYSFHVQAVSAGDFWNLSGDEVAECLKVPL
jgi:hypothetical protein